MPAIKKFERFLKILDDIDEKTISMICNLSEAKRIKFFNQFRKGELKDIDIEKLIIKINNL